MIDPVIDQLVIERMGEVYQDYARVLKELNDIREGKSVVVPVDDEHARFMQLVSQHWLDQRHKETFNALKKEYQND